LIAASHTNDGAAIPDFQRTRGALRFPATRSAQAAGKSRALFGPCDVPLHDPQVRLAFLRRLGSDPIFSHALSMTSSGHRGKCSCPPHRPALCEEVSRSGGEAARHTHRDGCPDVFLWRLAARGWRRVRDAASRHFRAGIAGHLRQPLPRQHARSRVPKGVVRSVQEEDLHSTQSTLVGEVEFVDGLASHSEQWAVVSSISPLKSGGCESYSSTRCATNGIWQKI
jgi:hypothetical protein